MVIMCLLTLSSMFSVFFAWYFSTDLTLQVNILSLLFYAFFNYVLSMFSWFKFPPFWFFITISFMWSVSFVVFISWLSWHLLYSCQITWFPFFTSWTLLLWIPLELHSLVTVLLPFLCFIITPLSSNDPRNSTTENSPGHQNGEQPKRSRRQGQEIPLDNLLC